jgi:hypothetical protein
VGFKAVDGFDFSVGYDRAGDFLTDWLDDRDSDAMRPELNEGSNSDKNNQQDDEYRNPGSASSAGRAVQISVSHE